MLNVLLLDAYWRGLVVPPLPEDQLQDPVPVRRLGGGPVDVRGEGQLLEALSVGVLYVDGEAVDRCVELYILFLDPK